MDTHGYSIRVIICISVNINDFRLYGSKYKIQKKVQFQEKKIGLKVRVVYLLCETVGTQTVLYIKDMKKLECLGVTITFNWQLLWVEQGLSAKQRSWLLLQLHIKFKLHINICSEN